MDLPHGIIQVSSLSLSSLWLASQIQDTLHWCSGLSCKLNWHSSTINVLLFSVTEAEKVTTGLWKLCEEQKVDIQQQKQEIGRLNKEAVQVSTFAVGNPGFWSGCPGSAENATTALMARGVEGEELQLQALDTPKCNT